MEYGTDMMLRRVDAMRKNGYSEKDIANFFGLTTAELRRHISIRNRDNRIVLCGLAKELKEAGKSVREIAIELGRNESSVRLLLDKDIAEQMKGNGAIPPDEVGDVLKEMREKGKTTKIEVEVTKA